MSRESLRSVGELSQLTLERLEVLRRDHSWQCSDCGEAWIGPNAGLCPRCASIREELRLRNLPKKEALETSGVPQDLRADHAWLADPWPRDRRPGAKGIDPAERFDNLVCKDCGAYEDRTIDDQCQVYDKDGFPVSHEGFIIVDARERGYQRGKMCCYLTTYNYICTVCGAWQTTIVRDEFDNEF